MNRHSLNIAIFVYLLYRMDGLLSSWACNCVPVYYHFDVTLPHVLAIRPATKPASPRRGVVCNVPRHPRHFCPGKVSLSYARAGDEPTDAEGRRHIGITVQTWGVLCTPGSELPMTLCTFGCVGCAMHTWERGQDTLHHGDEGKLPSLSGEKGTGGLSRRRGPSRGLAPRRKGNSYLSRCTRLTGNMRFVYSWLYSQIAALTGSTTMFTIAILHDMSCEDRSPGLTLGALLPG